VRQRRKIKKREHRAAKQEEKKQEHRFCKKQKSGVLISRGKRGGVIGRKRRAINHSQKEEGGDNTVPMGKMQGDARNQGKGIGEMEGGKGKGNN